MEKKSEMKSAIAMLFAMLKMDENKLRKRFAKVVAKSPEFLGLDKSKMTDMLVDWLMENRREITKQELDDLIAKAKK